MRFGPRVFGIATAAGLLAALALPAAAQSTSPTQPSTVPVPNSGTHIQCNANGTGTVTQSPNAEQSSNQTVPGTPVTQNNPNGPGTTTSQTPVLQKPTSSVATQCPQTPPASTNMQTTPQSTNGMTGNGPNGSDMNALTNNPNGANWIDKFNRPVTQSNSYATMKSKHKKHHAKRASGGGGY